MIVKAGKKKLNEWKSLNEINDYYIKSDGIVIFCWVFKKWNLNNDTIIINNITITNDCIKTLCNGDVFIYQSLYKKIKTRADYLQENKILCQGRYIEPL